MRFGNEQFDERGGVQIEDHPRCLPTISAKDLSPGFSRTLDRGTRGMPLPARIQAGCAPVRRPVSRQARRARAAAVRSGAPQACRARSRQPLRRLALGAGTRTSDSSTRGPTRPSGAAGIAGAGHCSHVGLVEATSAPYRHRTGTVPAPRPAAPRRRSLPQRSHLARCRRQAGRLAALERVMPPTAPRPTRLAW